VPIAPIAPEPRHLESTVAADRSTLLVSTRKGLFTVTGRGGDARITGASFVGDNVTLALADRRDGTWYAVLDHGHFGVKLHRSADRGATWTEIAVPAYPPRPEGLDQKDMWGNQIPWSLKSIWALEAAPDCSAPRTAAIRGRWSSRCGTTRCGRSGTAAAPTCP
jgi:hypothetical protein